MHDRGFFVGFVGFPPSLLVFFFVRFGLGPAFFAFLPAAFAFLGQSLLGILRRRVLLLKLRDFRFNLRPLGGFVRRMFVTPPGPA
jgi:hypothetical protein